MTSQITRLLDVTCCIRLHTLLRLVGNCCAKFETGQAFSYVQTDASTPNNIAFFGAEIKQVCDVVDF